MSLSGRDTALALGIVGLAEACGLSEVEVAGEEELGARAVAVVEAAAGTVHSDVQGAAIAELGKGTVALSQASLAGELGVNQGFRNAA